MSLGGQPLFQVPGQMQQAEDRAHRIGQRDCVSADDLITCAGKHPESYPPVFSEVHYLIANGTLDEVLFRTLEKKTVSRVPRRLAL